MSSFHQVVIIVSYESYVSKTDFLVFWGSSQARTRELKKEFEPRRLKELKDRVQAN